MSTGAIPYYFDLKDEVLIAALKWASERLFDRLDELSEAVGSERERLAQVLEVAVPHARTAAQRVRALDRAVGSGAAGGRACCRPARSSRSAGGATSTSRCGAAPSRASSHRCRSPARWRSG